MGSEERQPTAVGHAMDTWPSEPGSTPKCAGQCAVCLKYMKISLRSLVVRSDQEKGREQQWHNCSAKEPSRLGLRRGR